VKKLLSSILLMLPLGLAVPAVSQSAHAASFAHGPYLIDMSETTVTIMWYTDVDSTGKVEYGTGGTYTSHAIESEDGLVTVDKRHSVRLTGLVPGTTYNYRLVSTPVTDLLAYYPTTGTPITSAGYSFTTFDDSKESFSFYYMTDTHENISRVNTLLGVGESGGANRSDFVVHTGDTMNSVESENQVFDALIDPIVDAFAKNKPLVFARGNHDMRGHYARKLKPYFPLATGKWYYGFNHGPASFAVLDTAEDKPDNSTVFSGLVAAEPYLEEELSWFQNYASGSAFQNNPFKILLMHQPGFGAAPNVSAWRQAANDAGVQLVLAGHWHDLLHFWPGEEENYHTLILGQDQIAKVKVSSNAMLVTVLDQSGQIIDGFEVNLTPNIDTDYSGYNMAQYKVVDASSSYESANWGMSHLTDKNRSSTSGSLGWMSSSSTASNHTEWATVDLEGVRKISRVDLYPRNDAGQVGEGFPIDFNIQVSDDNANWTTVVTKTGYAKPGNAAQGFSFPEQDARYVRVTGTGLRPNPSASNKYYMQFAEIEVYGGNKAAHRKVSFSSSMEYGIGGWSAQAATDTIRDMTYNSSYGWSSYSNLSQMNHTEWITVDLEANTSISKVDLYPRDTPDRVGEGFPVDFKIKVSTDNVNWTTVVTETNYPQPSDQVQSFSFTAQTARYVRVEGTKLREDSGDHNYYMQLAEIEVY